MNTSESIPDNRSGKQPFFVNQYSKIFFLGACAFFILSQILENVYYYFLTPEENALSTGLFLGWNFCLILFLILLPLGMGLNVRRFKLSHCWLFLILFSFLLALSDVFGVQHPYVDEIFWGEPFKRILFNWGVNFV